MSNPQSHPVRRKTLQTGAWTVVAVLLVILGVALLSTVDGTDGKPWISNNIVIQTLLTISAVAAIALPTLISARKDVAETNRTTAIVRDQVQNSHTVNLRDDQDQKHDVVVNLLDEFRRSFDTKVEGLHTDLRGMRRDIGRNSDQIDRHGTVIQRLGEQFQEHKDQVATEFESVESKLEEIKISTGSIAITKPRQEDENV